MAKSDNCILIINDVLEHDISKLSLCIYQGLIKASEILPKFPSGLGLYKNESNLNYGDTVEFSSEENHINISLMIHPTYKQLRDVINSVLKDDNANDNYIIYIGSHGAGYCSDWFLSDGIVSPNALISILVPHQSSGDNVKEDVQRPLNIIAPGNSTYWNKVLSKLKLRNSSEGRVRVFSFSQGSETDDQSMHSEINTFVKIICDRLQSQTNTDISSNDLQTDGHLQMIDKNGSLYVFDEGSGQSSLLTLNGFNLLIDAGYSHSPAFWKDLKTFDRIDTCLMTNWNETNVFGIQNLLKQRSNQIGPCLNYCILPIGPNLSKPSADIKVKSCMEINLELEAINTCKILQSLEVPMANICRDDKSIISPHQLYFKLGHGCLDAFQLWPRCAETSADVKKYVDEWHKMDKEQSIHFDEMIKEHSTACLLLWNGSKINDLNSSNDNLMRILVSSSCHENNLIKSLEEFSKTYIYCNTPNGKPIEKKIEDKKQKSMNITNKVIGNSDTKEKLGVNVAETHKNKVSGEALKSKKVPENKKTQLSSENNKMNGITKPESVVKTKDVKIVSSEKSAAQKEPVKLEKKLPSKESTKPEKKSSTVQMPLKSKEAAKVDKKPLTPEKPIKLKETINIEKKAAVTEKVAPKKKDEKEDNKAPKVAASSVPPSKLKTDSVAKMKPVKSEIVDSSKSSRLSSAKSADVPDQKKVPKKEVTTKKPLVDSKTKGNEAAKKPTVTKSEGDKATGKSTTATKLIKKPVQSVTTENKPKNANKIPSEVTANKIELESDLEKLDPACHQPSISLNTDDTLNNIDTTELLGKMEEIGPITDRGPDVKLTVASEIPDLHSTPLSDMITDSPEHPKTEEDVEPLKTDGISIDQDLLNANEDLSEDDKIDNIKEDDQFDDLKQYGIYDDDAEEEIEGAKELDNTHDNQYDDINKMMSMAVEDGHMNVPDSKDVFEHEKESGDNKCLEDAVYSDNSKDGHDRIDQENKIEELHDEDNSKPLGEDIMHKVPYEDIHDGPRDPIESHESFIEKEIEGDMPSSEDEKGLRNETCQEIHDTHQNPLESFKDVLNKYEESIPYSGHDVDIHKDAFENIYDKHQNPLESHEHLMEKDNEDGKQFSEDENEIHNKQNENVSQQNSLGSLENVMNKEDDDKKSCTGEEDDIHKEAYEDMHDSHQNPPKDHIDLIGKEIEYDRQCSEDDNDLRDEPDENIHDTNQNPFESLENVMDKEDEDNQSCSGEEDDIHNEGYGDIHDSHQNPLESHDPDLIEKEDENNGQFSEDGDDVCKKPYVSIRDTFQSHEGVIDKENRNNRSNSEDEYDIHKEDINDTHESPLESLQHVIDKDDDDDRPFSEDGNMIHEVPFQDIHDAHQNILESHEDLIEKDCDDDIPCSEDDDGLNNEACVEIHNTNQNPLESLENVHDNDDKVDRLCSEEEDEMCKEPFKDLRDTHHNPLDSHTDFIEKEDDDDRLCSEEEDCPPKEAYEDIYDIHTNPIESDEDLVEQEDEDNRQIDDDVNKEYSHFKKDINICDVYDYVDHDAVDQIHKYEFGIDKDNSGEPEESIRDENIHKYEDDAVKEHDACYDPQNDYEMDVRNDNNDLREDHQDPVVMDQSSELKGNFMEIKDHEVPENYDDIIDNEDDDCNDEQGDNDSMVRHLDDSSSDDISESQDTKIVKVNEQEEAEHSNTNELFEPFDKCDMESKDESIRPLESSTILYDDNLDNLGSSTKDWSRLVTGDGDNCPYFASPRPDNIDEHKPDIIPFDSDIGDFTSPDTSDTGHRFDSQGKYYSPDLNSASPADSDLSVDIVKDHSVLDVDPIDVVEPGTIKSMTPLDERSEDDADVTDDNDDMTGYDPNLSIITPDIIKGLKRTNLCDPGAMSVEQVVEDEDLFQYQTVSTHPEEMPREISDLTDIVDSHMIPQFHDDVTKMVDNQSNISERGSSVESGSSVLAQKSTDNEGDFMKNILSSRSITENVSNGGSCDISRNDDIDPLSQWNEPLGMPTPAPMPASNKPTSKSSDVKTSDRNKPSLPATKLKSTPPKLNGSLSNNAIKVAQKSSESPKSALSPRTSVTPKSTAKSADVTKAPVQAHSNKPINIDHSKLPAFYFEVAYIPVDHDGNASSGRVTETFFTRIRARRYILSGVEHDSAVLDSLLSARQKWPDSLDTEVCLVVVTKSETIVDWARMHADQLARLNLTIDFAAVAQQPGRSSVAALHRIDF